MQEDDATSWGCSGPSQHPPGSYGPSEQVAVEEAGACYEVYQHQQAERRQQQETPGIRK